MKGLALIGCETDKIFHMFRLSEPSEDVTIDHDSVAIVRFVHHQLLEMARDCLLKSTERLVTSRYILIRLMNECFTGKTLFSDISTRCLKTWRSCWSRQETSHQKLLLTWHAWSRNCFWSSQGLQGCWNAWSLIQRSSISSWKLLRDRPGWFMVFRVIFHRLDLKQSSYSWESKSVIISLGHKGVRTIC